MDVHMSDTPPTEEQLAQLRRRIEHGRKVKEGKAAERWIAERQAAEALEIEAEIEACKEELGPLISAAATAPDDIIAGRAHLPRQSWEPPAAAIDFDFFLASLDAETKTLLSDDELRKIYETQLAAALDEKRAARRRQAMDIANHAARMASGLVPADTQEAMETLKRNSRIVRIPIELPPSGEHGELPDIGLRIDQRVFLHGRTYEVTEAQAASMREMMYRVGEMELLFKGQNARQRRWLMGRAVGSIEREISGAAA
jgi:hypothetical protein